VSGEANYRNALRRHLHGDDDHDHDEARVDALQKKCAVLEQAVQRYAAVVEKQHSIIARYETVIAAWSATKG
jgi:hypothetical protein